MFTLAIFTNDIAYASAHDFTRPALRVVVDNQLLQDHGAVLQNGVQVPATAFTKMFGGEVGVNIETQSMTITNGDRTYMPTTTLIERNAFMDPHYIGLIFGYNVEYFADINVLSINTRGGNFNTNDIRTIAPTFNGYTQDDLHWMARIIFAEARGENFEGMVAVGSVVMNRTYYPAYPDTVHGVIFDRRNGVQFSPVSNGSINNTPCVMTFLAAVDVLEGRRNASNALFFKNPSIVRTSWISNNRTYAFTLQSHAFFY